MNISRLKKKNIDTIAIVTDLLLDCFVINL